MAYGTVNADVIQSSVSGVSLGAGNATNFKNRIINGAMVIDQRNAGASVTPSTLFSTYTLDRWAAGYSVGSKFSVQQNAGSVTPPAGFSNYLGITSLSSYTVGTGDYFVIAQSIEGLNIADLGWGTANAKTVTLSFWVYSSLTGTFGGSIINSVGNRSYPFSYTVSSANTWTQISITITGDTTGTWLTTNGIGASVRFSLGAGSTFTGTGGAWAAANYVQPTGATSVVGTNGATFYITGVQLEVGSSATGFEYRDYGRELQMCQRYLYAVDSNGITNGIAPASTQLWFVTTYPVRMRGTPTASATGTLQVSNNTTTDFTLASPNLSVIQGTNVGSRARIDGWTGLTIGTFYAGYSTGTPSGQIFFSAEL